MAEKCHLVTVFVESDDFEDLAESREDLLEDVDRDRIQHILNNHTQHRPRFIHVRHQLVGRLKRCVRTCVLKPRHDVTLRRIGRSEISYEGN